MVCDGRWIENDSLPFLKDADLCYDHQAMNEAGLKASYTLILQKSSGTRKRAINWDHATNESGTPMKRGNSCFLFSVPSAIYIFYPVTL